MIYIDVRTPAEFAEQHYPNALNHPVELMMQGVMPNVPKASEICLYCRSGGRAGAALIMMQQSGFSHVINGGGLDDIRGE